MTKHPDRTEVAEYYFTYIDKVGPGNIVDLLARQGRETVEFFEGISEEQSLHRYAPDKWTIREMLAHVNDTERLFVGRAFWFARGFDSPLPSFDPNVAVTLSRANERSWRSHIEEFHAIRSSTIAFFDNLPDGAWDRRGIASDNPFSVRALAYLCVGHVVHHTDILRKRYLS